MITQGSNLTNICVQVPGQLTTAEDKLKEIGLHTEREPLRVRVRAEAHCASGKSLKTGISGKCLNLVRISEESSGISDAYFSI